MTSFRNVTIALAAILGFGCSGGGDDTQVITGNITASTASAVAVRAVAGDQVIAAGAVRTDGSFTLALPSGKTYRLEVLDAAGAAHHIVGTANGTYSDLSFRVCHGGAPWDVGGVGDGTDPGSGSGGCDGGGHGSGSGMGGPGGGSGSGDPSGGTMGCDPTTGPCDPPPPPPCDPTTGTMCDPGGGGTGCDPTTGPCDPPPPPPPCDPTTGTMCDPGGGTGCDPTTGPCDPPPCDPTTGAMCDPSGGGSGTDPGGNPGGTMPPPPPGGGMGGHPPPPPPCTDPMDPSTCQDPCMDPASCGCSSTDPTCWPPPGPPCDPTTGMCDPSGGGDGGMTPTHPPHDFGCDDDGGDPSGGGSD